MRDFVETMLKLGSLGFSWAVPQGLRNSSTKLAVHKPQPRLDPYQKNAENGERSSALHGEMERCFAAIYLAFGLSVVRWTQTRGGACAALARLAEAAEAASSNASSYHGKPLASAGIRFVNPQAEKKKLCCLADLAIVLGRLFPRLHVLQDNGTQKYAEGVERAASNLELMRNKKSATLQRQCG